MTKNNFKIKKSDLILFFNRLEMYISSGFAIDKALAIIASSSGKRLKRPLDLIGNDLGSGEHLSKSLLRRFSINSSLFNLIENGENSGRLKESLIFCSELLEKESNLQKKCLGALTYPLVIGIFSFGLTLFLIQGVMKQIIPLLRSLKIALPISTKILIFFSSFITKYYLLIIIFLIIIVPLSHFIYKKYQITKYLFQKFLIKIPILGKTIIQYQAFIVTKSIGSLLRAGLGIDSAYRDVFFHCRLIPFRDHFMAYSRQITEGLPVYIPFSKFHLAIYIPALIEAGELSGQLANSFIKCSDLIEKDMDSFIKRFTVLIEPLMMILVGSIVGFVAVSIMLPIYSISNTLQK